MHWLPVYNAGSVEHTFNFQRAARPTISKMQFNAR